MLVRHPLTTIYTRQQPMLIRFLPQIPTHPIVSQRSPNIAKGFSWLDSNHHHFLNGEDFESIQSRIFDRFAFSCVVGSNVKVYGSQCFYGALERLCLAHGLCI
jgi:hypothetical protein